MYDSSWYTVVYKNFRLDTIFKISQEPQELHRFTCACGFIGKSPMICHSFLSKVLISINGKSPFNQLATVLHIPLHPLIIDHEYSNPVNQMTIRYTWDKWLRLKQNSVNLNSCHISFIDLLFSVTNQDP